MESQSDENCRRITLQPIMNIQIFKLALRNIFRHRARSAATLAAISIGVAGLILAGGFVQDIFVQLGEAIIHSQTGHIQITQKGYSENKTRAPEKFLINNADELREVLTKASLPITRTLSRLNFTGVINNGRRDLGIIGEGIEPDKEAALGSFLHYVAGKPLSDGDREGVVIGEGVANSLGLKVGDQVSLVVNLAAGAVNTLEFEVVGIFQSFSKDFDARAIRIPLSTANALLDNQGIHVLIVELADTNVSDVAAERIAARLGAERYDVHTWRNLSDFYEKTVELYDRQFGILRFIILLMVLLSVINSVNMTLFERTREFGTMRALGDRSARVFILINLECLFLGVFGAVCGILLGYVGGVVISAIGIPMPPPPNANLGYIASIQLDVWSALAAGSIGFIATVFAAVFPAKRASKFDIVNALRQGV